MRKAVVFLTTCLLISCALLGVVSASDAAVYALRDSDLNFSENSQTASGVTLDAVLESLLGEPITDAERNVLRYKFSGNNVLQYTRPDVNSPTVSYDGESGTLVLTLEDDYYVTQSGGEVIWTPASATVGQHTATFEPAPDLGETYYRATFEQVEWTPSVSFTVEYQSDFVLSASVLNEFINFAYQRALTLDSEMQAYELRLTEYNQKVLDYERNRADWEQYEVDLDAYNVYEERLALYQSYLAYQQYLKDLAKYEQDYKDWQTNVAAWESYQKSLASYKEYQAYKLQYPALAGTVERQLSLLALMEKPDPLTGASFIDRLIDDRMTDIIKEYRDLLELTVGDPVQHAIDASGELKRFAVTLKGLTDPEARYRYYMAQYSSFVFNLNKMYENVRTIYSHQTVYNTINNRYPDDAYKMERMLGYLYAYRCVFGDTYSLKLSTVVDLRGNQTASALVDPSLLPATDTNQATPLATWPVDPETYPVKNPPTAPAVRLDQPTPPAVVTDPGVGNMEKPAEVAEPVPPALTLAHPGIAPTLGWDDCLTALYAAYENGEIVQRPTYSSAQSVTLRANGQYSASLSGDQHYCFVEFYNSDQNRTYLDTVAVKYGAAAAYQGVTPTKAADVYNEYVFTGWVYEDGSAADLSAVAESIKVYAAYTTAPRKYTVTWDMGDRLIEQAYTYGQTPSFEGTPQRAPGAQYSYEFVGWDKEIVPVSGNVTYTAKYSTTLNRYTVIFDLGEAGIKTYTYTYGYDLRDVAYNLGTPSKSPTVQHSYTFAGWKDQHGNVYANSEAFPTLTGPVTFVAQFDANVNYYKVTWDVEGVQSEQTLAFGEMPYFGATPTKDSTPQYDFVFESWDKEVVAVSGDVTYTACFTPVLRSYEIVFIVDGQPHTVTVPYGEVPHFDGNVEKPSDVEFSYTFIGWDKELVAVEGEATYMARFGNTLRKYPVIFVVDGKEILAECEYGSIPEYPYGTPEHPDDNRYRYVFAGWDRELAAVDGSEVSYEAKFDAVALAPIGGGTDCGVLNVGADGEMNLQVNGTDVNLSLIFEKAGESGADLLTVDFGAAKVVFNKALINAVYNMGGGIAGVSITPSVHDGKTAIEITLTDEQGAPVAFLVSEVKIMLPYNGSGTPDIFHLEDDGSLRQLQTTLEKGYVCFSTMDFSTFVIKEKFKVEQGQTENGVISVSGTFYDGEVVTVTPDPDQGYHVDTVSVTCNGESVEVSVQNGVYTFVMPKGDVQINATFKVVEGGTAAEVMVGAITAVLIVAIGIVIAVVLGRKKHARV